MAGRRWSTSTVVGLSILVVAVVVGGLAVHGALRSSPQPSRWARVATGQDGTEPSPEPTTAGSAPQRPAVQANTEPMPTGNPPGWRTVFADDFQNGGFNPRDWKLYSGQPKGDTGGGLWAPSHVVVNSTGLALRSYRDAAFGGSWVTGGLSNSPGLKQTYGQYLVRMEMTPGSGVAYAVLLWPAAGGWPPEIDFAEDKANTGANQLLGTLHYVNNLGQKAKITNRLAINMTQWHTVGVKWSPGELQFTVDGSVWATISGSEVPSVPMELDIQTEEWPCGNTKGEECPGPTTPPEMDLNIAWVVEYAYAPGS